MRGCERVSNVTFVVGRKHQYCCGPVKFEPFALTLRRGSGQDLSKGSAYNLGFDKLSPNGN